MSSHVISQHPKGKPTRELPVFLYISSSVKFISCYQAIKQRLERLLGIDFYQPLHPSCYQ